MTFGEACGVAALAVVGFYVLIRLIFYWSTRI
jgi:hypothetical protein